MPPRRERQAQHGPEMTEKRRNFSTYTRTEQFGIKTVSLGISKFDENGEPLGEAALAKKAEGCVARACDDYNSGGPEDVFVFFTGNGAVAHQMRTVFRVLGAKFFDTSFTGTTRDGQEYIAPRTAAVVYKPRALTDEEALNALLIASKAEVWLPRPTTPA